MKNIQSASNPFGATSPLYAPAPNAILPGALRRRGGKVATAGDLGALYAHVTASSVSGEATRDKLQDRVLLLGNPRRADRRGKSADVPRERAADRRRRKCRSLTASERKRLAVHRLSRDIPYAELQPLHDAWKAYAREMLDGLGLSGDAVGGIRHRDALAERVLRMDWHGAYITVQRSTAPEQIGWQGIVLQETENTFRVVTPESRLRVVPKRPCDLLLQLDERVRVRVHGAAMAMRSAERSVRRPKRRPDSMFA